jgi:hypothetical protein
MPHRQSLAGTKNTKSIMTVGAITQVIALKYLGLFAYFGNAPRTVFGTDLARTEITA